MKELGRTCTPKKLLFVITIIALFISCKKETTADGKNDGKPADNAKVYYFTSDGLYLNDKKISATNPGMTATLDENGDIVDYDAASVFKNGTPISTPTSTMYYHVLCYYIDGNDVYTGGYEYYYTPDIHLYSRIAYWKNGEKMPLDFDNWSDADFIFSISSIGKYKGDIYIAGDSRIGNIAYAPSRNMLWKNGKFVYPTDYYTYYAYQHPITVNGQLVFVTKDSNGTYRLYHNNGSFSSNYFDVTTAFSFLRCENGDDSYTVSTRIFNDVGYLQCKAGNVALDTEHRYLVSATYNGTDEYVCLGDRSTRQHNIVYKNGVKMDLPAVFANIDVYRIIAK